MGLDIKALVSTNTVIGMTPAENRHNTFVKAVQIRELATGYIRRLAAEIYLDKTYRDLRFTDEATGEVWTFDTFEEWLEYAAYESNMGDSTKSAIKVFTEYVVDPVSKGLVVDPNGNPYTIDDVVDMREGHAQKLASAARGVLRDPSKDDTSKIAQLSEFVQMAKDESVLIGEFVDALRQAGASTQRNAPLTIVKSFVNEKAVYMIIVDEKDSILAESRMNGEYKMMAIGDVVSTLMDIQLTQQDISTATTEQDSDLSSGVALGDEGPELGLPSNVGVEEIDQFLRKMMPEEEKEGEYPELGLPW